MTTTVQKSKLLDTMRHNRDEHRGIFLEAQKNYRTKVIELLDQRLQNARDGGKIDLYFGLPEPVDYTDTYDEAIERYTWHEGDTVDLSDNEFRQYVLNKWGWEQQFMASTAIYNQKS